METIEFHGHNGDYFRLTIEEVQGFPKETSPFGGYETQSTIEIKSGSYAVKGNVWITTGNIYSLYERLLKCQETNSDFARLDSYENNLSILFEYDKFGNVTIKGQYTENYILETCLNFKILSDQSFIQQSINSLEEMYQKYGDNTGKR